jgi:hypothetical protein
METAASFEARFAPSSYPTTMAAASTKDALQFALRRGMKCFDDPDNRRRLADRDADEFKALLAELHIWPGGRHWLRTWPETELRDLTALCGKLGERSAAGLTALSASCRDIDRVSAGWPGSGVWIV